MPKATIDPTEFNTSPLTVLARRVLTERQYEIWIRTERDGWPAWRLAQFLRVSLSTVTHELTTAKRILRQEIAFASPTGQIEHPFKITIQEGQESRTVADETALAVSKKLDKFERRRGRIPVQATRKITA